LNRDPRTYDEDAAQFNPARYLDAKFGLAYGLSHTKGKRHVAYGFGRRICVGRHVTNNSHCGPLFAVVLWTSKIERKKDE
ncbi:hypothetical protein BJV78DRAFT_1074824, partial [Lactifluus subvellereus]